jgi:hypothetical protein
MVYSRINGVQEMARPERLFQILKSHENHWINKISKPVDFAH